MKSKSRVILVTPHRATEWLRIYRYPRQRDLSMPHVRELVFAMENKEFATATAIAFCRVHKGGMYLVDGQHRLAAVAESGIPQWFTMIIHPVPNMEAVDSFWDKFDIQLKRTISQALKAHDLPKKLGISPAGMNYIVACYGPIVTEFSIANIKGARRPDLRSRDVRKRFVESWINPAKDYLECFDPITRPSPIPWKLRNVSHINYIMGLGMITMRDQPSLALDFWMEVALGRETNGREPRRRLREAMLSWYKDHSINGPLMSRGVASAWNSFYKGIEMGSIDTSARRMKRMLLLGCDLSKHDVNNY